MLYMAYSCWITIPKETRCHAKEKSWTLTLIIKIVIFPIREGIKLDKVINRQITEGEFKFILTLGLWGKTQGGEI